MCPPDLQSLFLLGTLMDSLKFFFLKDFIHLGEEGKEEREHCLSQALIGDLANNPGLFLLNRTRNL